VPVLQTEVRASSLTDPAISLQTRDGYFALPELKGEAIQPFEMPALHILDSSPRNDFVFRDAAMRFQPVSGGYGFEMSFAAPMASLTMPQDANTRKARVHAIFLALIKDAAGQGWCKGSAAKLTARSPVNAWNSSAAARRS
jgi:hypothetical protein